MLAQLGHAAGESAAIFGRLIGPLPEGTRMVVLKVADERELLDLARELRDERVPHSLIYEPDAPWNGAAMAIGVHPGRRSERKFYFRHLSLLR